MHTHIDPHLEQLHVAVQLLREWADHCHNQTVTDQLIHEDPENEAQDSNAVLPMHPGDRQAIYRYGYAVALEDAASLLDDLLAM